MKVLEKIVTETDEVVLYELHDDSHWTHTIHRYVLDGKNYGRPQQKTCVSTANFTDYETALSRFNER